MNWRRTGAMFRKEFLHIIRDGRSLVAALVQPLMMLMLFGYALSLDVDRIPVFIYDESNTPQSQDLINEFKGSRYFTIAGQAQGYKPIERAMDTRRALIGVVIPYDFATNLATGHKEATVQLLIDGSDSNTASIAAGYAEALVQGFAVRLREDAQSMRAGTVLKPVVEPRVRVWYNTDLVSRNYIVPGLIAVILMIIASILTSLTVAREWENGTMEQLLSTPVRPIEIALGKLGAYFVLGMTDLLMSLAVGLWVFHVPFKGSPVLLFVSSCVFLFGALAWGIMISASTRSQLVAYQLSTLTSFLPAFLLSGFIYSIQNMPRVIQLIALFVPARYFINIIKGVFLKGVGLEILWFDFLLLVVYGLVVFRLATQKLRQKVA
jgi:ABC-2 type transport system permease protein